MEDSAYYDSDDNGDNYYDCEYSLLANWDTENYPITPSAPKVVKPVAEPPKAEDKPPEEKKPVLPSIKKIDWQKARYTYHHSVDNLATTYQSERDVMNIRNVVIFNRNQHKLFKALSVPVDSDKGSKMMRKMGWEGGALGKNSDGIVEPIMPSLTTMTGVGLGHKPERKLPKPREPPKKVDPSKFPVQARKTFRVRALQLILELVEAEDMESNEMTLVDVLKKKEKNIFNTFLHNVFNMRKDYKFEPHEEDLASRIMAVMRERPSVIMSISIAKDQKKITLSKEIMEGGKSKKKLQKLIQKQIQANIKKNAKESAEPEVENKAEAKVQNKAEANLQNKAEAKVQTIAETKVQNQNIVATKAAIVPNVADVMDEVQKELQGVAAQECKPVAHRLKFMKIIEKFLEQKDATEIQLIMGLTVNVTVRFIEAIIENLNLRNKTWKMQGFVSKAERKVYLALLQIIDCTLKIEFNSKERTMLLKKVVYLNNDDAIQVINDSDDEADRESSVNEANMPADAPKTQNGFKTPVNDDADLGVGSIRLGSDAKCDKVSGSDRVIVNSVPPNDRCDANNGSMCGKRLNQSITDAVSAKRSRLLSVYATKTVAIVLANSSEAMGDGIAARVQQTLLVEMSKIINRNNLPRLKCYGLRDGKLVYGAENEYSRNWLMIVVERMRVGGVELRIEDVEADDDEGAVRVAMQFNSFVIEDYAAVFKRLELYNGSVDTKGWVLLQEFRTSSEVVYVIEVSKASHQALVECDFHVNVGIDLARFSSFST